MSSEVYSLQFLLLKALRLSLIAGDAIMEVYGRSDFSIEMKEDNSPLTLADKTSNSIIVDGIKDFGIPVLSEEGSEISWEIRKDWERYWLIDPLDGTKEFIKRNDEFTVNIALMEKNIPILGVVYLPVLKCLYFALKGHGAYRLEQVEQVDLNVEFEQILNNSTRLPDQRKGEGIKVVASRSHLSQETEVFIKELKGKGEKIDLVPAGSSLKLCLIAE
ncbi:MAG: 3'(2'),5'-bisphosphate nucleotidase CysQ, partial [Bacteroidota bacterium]|nr:3'(2'),5'-bisphosphate nucleotidase CysQ [Bacteroidota bacterium]